MQPENKWLLLRSGAGNAAFNMALDEALLASMPRLGLPILRFYSWTEPAASFGYFQKFSEISRMTLLRPMVRRMTAGGLVPHDADWTYSVAFPAGHKWHELKAVESYSRIHEWLHASFARIGIQTTLASSRRLSAPGQCFEGHEQSDVLWQGRKVAGAAQRRTRDGLLIQGSIQPFFPEPDRGQWEEAMLEIGRGNFGIEWELMEPLEWLASAANGLVRLKYSTSTYNQKR
jgi:lipoate-protein ligase A